MKNVAEGRIIGTLPVGLPGQCFDIGLALRPDGWRNPIGAQSFNNVTSDRLFLIIQKRVRLGLCFSGSGGSRIAESPQIRKDIILLRSGDCLQDSLWSLSGFRNEEVYAMIVATFPGEFYSGGVSNVIGVEEVSNILEKEARDSRLAHHKHVVNSQHRLNEGV